MQRLHHISVSFFLLLLLLCSCDERISPAVQDDTNTNTTDGTTAIQLTSYIWEIDEVISFSNDSTKTVFSKPKNIGLSTSYNSMFYTFYSDNTVRESTGGIISVATWKLQQSDTQLEITNDKQVATLYNLSSLTATSLVLQNRFFRLTFKVLSPVNNTSGDTTATAIARKWLYDEITFTALSKSYTAYKRGLSNNKILEVDTHQLVFGKDGSFTIIDEDNLSTFGTWELKNQAKTIVQKLSDANITSEDSYTISTLTNKNFNYNKDINTAQKTELDEAYLIWATKSGVNIGTGNKINVAIKLIPKP